MRRPRRWLLLVGALLACGPGLAQSGDPADATTRPGAVVSAHRLATEAGLDTLRRGGTAADASIAVAAVLSVVEPWFSSAFGGGTWALYYDAARDEVTSLDGVGPVGSLATVDDFARRADRPGIHQAIVPGAWSGWIRWSERYGALPLDEVLAPAIAAGREGYEVHPAMRAWMVRLEDEILADPAARAIYAPEGRLLDVGEHVRQLDLAATFEAVSAAYRRGSRTSRAEGLRAAHDHVYRGPVADAIVAASDAGGGYLVLDDLASFEAEIVEPISIPFGDGLRVYQNPPNSQGITMLIALAILDGMALEELSADDPAAIHLQVEALKLAFEDRHEHVGDPDRVHVPVERLLSERHAAEQRARIREDRALSWPFGGASDDAPEPGAARPFVGQPPRGTTTFHVVDGHGNAAAVTTSLGAQFRVIPGTGVHINNRMRFLALDEGDPNRLAPGVKVRHTSSPYLVLRRGGPYLLGGNTGVDTQPQAQLQQFLRVAVFGDTPHEAVAAPRFVSTAFPATTYPYEVGNRLQLEPTIPLPTSFALGRLGHDLAIGPGIYGTGAMLRVDGNDVDVGADPRYPTAWGSVLEPAPR